jgi:predicted nucleotide-binding protein
MYEQDSPDQNEMDAAEAIAALDDAIAQIPALRNGRRHSPEHVAFIQSTGLELARIFGPESTVSKNFSRITYTSSGSILTSYYSYEEDMARVRHEAYLQGLDVAEGILRSAKAQLERHGADRILRASRVRVEGAKVFISHGREGPALNKLERFLRALGTTPVIVVREPSEGMAVDDLVEKRMAESDCVVVLATADDLVEGRKQPRPNVIHEIGMAQEKVPNKIVYLKEEGCQFPSNVSPRVWGNFTHDNMEEAFEKVSKELRAFGLL